MQADFSYDPVRDAAGCQLSVTLIADRAAMREELKDDALQSGFRIRTCASFADYATREFGGVGDLVLIDCAKADAAVMATLCRIDDRIKRAGSQLIVTTTMEALDTVYCCLTADNAQVLVDAGRGERIIALGRVLAKIPNLHVQEFAADDRLMLLRLTEQVENLAKRMEALTPGQRAGGGAFMFESPANAWAPEPTSEDRKFKPRLPNAKTIRTLIRNRQLRSRFFDGDLFADPAWDILLDLAAARAENLDVSVSSVCIASAVPPTTALRWISQMVDSGLLVRVSDPLDKRRAHVALSDKSAELMASYFAEIGIDSQTARLQVV